MLRLAAAPAQHQFGAAERLGRAVAAEGMDPPERRVERTAARVPLIPERNSRSTDIVSCGSGAGFSANSCACTRRTGPAMPIIASSTWIPVPVIAGRRFLGRIAPRREQSLPRPHC